MLLFVSSAATYYLYTHGGLDRLIQQEFAGYILSIKHHSADWEHYNWKGLWEVTYPVWLKSWVLIGVIGCWQEINYDRRSPSAAILLRDQERQRQAKLQRGKNKAMKRARRPGRLPDSPGGGLMTIGIPIHEETRE